MKIVCSNSRSLHVCIFLVLLFPSPLLYSSFIFSISNHSVCYVCHGFFFTCSPCIKCSPYLILVFQLLKVTFSFPAMDSFHLHLYLKFNSEAPLKSEKQPSTIPRCFVPLSQCSIHSAMENVMDRCIRKGLGRGVQVTSNQNLS